MLNFTEFLQQLRHTLLLHPQQNRLARTLFDVRQIKQQLLDENCPGLTNSLQQKLVHELVPQERIVWYGRPITKFYCMLPWLVGLICLPLALLYCILLLIANLQLKLIILGIYPIGAAFLYGTFYPCERHLNHNVLCMPSLINGY